MSIIDKQLEEVLFFLTERMMRQVREQTKAQLKREEIEVTIDQWIILKRVSEQNGISQVDLANSTFKDPAAVTRMLDILEKKQYIERQRKPDDRRTHEIFLTHAGLLIVQQIIPIAQHWRAQSVKGIPEAEIETAKKVMRLMYSNLQ